MIRRPPRSTLSSSSAASDVYKRQHAIRARLERTKRLLEMQAACGLPALDHQSVPREVAVPKNAMDGHEAAAKLHQLFVAADIDGSGSLDSRELIQVVRAFYKEHSKSRSIKAVAAEVEQAMRRFDRVRWCECVCVSWMVEGVDGTVDLVEFAEMMSSPDCPFKFPMAEDELVTMQQNVRAVYRSRNHQGEGARTDLHGRPLRLHHQELDLVFRSYDHERKGRISQKENALQLVTNLIFTLNLDVKVEEIEPVVEHLWDWSEGLDLVQFENTFYQLLDFSLEPGISGYSYS
eukprot:TRINITY_DN18728_c0_g1_i1.p1 TRINITY_DN18728_c0_g1~~TRINITY_DN18728_c0_g1_i1.p1  ORF type:complete len:291 (+),score=66.11 TRINITY_DN18728_c0_g1_i1:120-992(+)